MEEKVEINLDIVQDLLKADLVVELEHMVLAILAAAAAADILEVALEDIMVP